MGKGDKKSRRGKLFKGSYGIRRQKKSKNTPIPVVKTTPEIPKATKEARPPREEARPISQAKEVKEVRSITVPKSTKSAAPVKKDVKPKKTEI